MTLEELRAHLNALRVDPAWKQGWLDRGADYGAVYHTLKHKLFAQAIVHWEAGDKIAWNNTLAIIMDYVACKHWEALILPPHPDRDPDPDYYESEGKKQWIKFITTCNPMQTYSQAVRVFHDRYGFWPRWSWPGTLKRECKAFSEGRLLNRIPREEFQPGLPADMSNEPITD